MAKQATIREVAKLAGVSIATASRALNNPDYPVDARLRQKVRDAADKLQYVPNVMAQALRRDSCHDIGLVIPNVSNPFYLQTMLGINNVLAQQSYQMILCNTMRNAEQERSYLRQLYERQTKGIIISTVDESCDVIKEYARRGMKFVLLDQLPDGVESPGIHFDSRAGARMAAEYLISQGHRRIAFATMPMTRCTRIEMHKGYRDAHLMSNLPYDPALVYESAPDPASLSDDPELQAGHEIASRFLHDGRKATAIMCNNDMVAIGVIQTLLKHGVRVPQDVSVMGFDDIPFASAFLPALTTIHCPAAETGRLAALMMLDMLSNNTNNAMAVSMNLAPSLVVRDSVCAITPA